jgi:hypothetical protein
MPQRFWARCSASLLLAYFQVESSRLGRSHAAFELELTLVHVFAPQFSFQTYGEHNPVIRVYKIP